MNVSDRFDSYQEKIQTIKSSFASPLSGIMNYTLSDADKFINISLFNEKIKQVSQSDIDNVLAFVSLASTRNKELLTELESDALLNDSQKKFLLNSAFHTQTGLDMLMNAVYIEAEKGGFVLEQHVKDKLLHDIEKYETTLYGPRISDIENEKKSVVGFLSQLYTSKNAVIPPEERVFFGDFLNKFGGGLLQVKQQSTLTTPDYKQYDASIVASVFDKIYRVYGENPVVIYEKNGLETPMVQDGKYCVPIGLHAVDKKKFYKDCGIDTNTKIIVSDKAANFSVGYNKDTQNHTLTFPSHNSYSFERLCQLIDHEIGTHFVRNKNASVGVDVKSAGYLEIEEGIATANEQLVTKNWSDISAGDPTIHHISTFIAENYNAAYTLKLLTIYYKLLGKSEEAALKEATSRTERVKRYHANDLPGANRKDTVYWRGMRTVVDYLKNVDVDTLQHDADLLYRGKFSSNDLPAIDGLFDGLKMDPAQRISPLALGKILYERYQGNEISQQTLQEKDKRFALQSEKLTFSQKKQLLDILRMVK